MQHQRVQLVFDKSGDIVQCLPAETKQEEHGGGNEAVTATISDHLASVIIAKLDGDLTKRRYAIAWRLAERYLGNYGCRTSGQKTISANNRVQLSLECPDGDKEPRYGTFECQFAVDSPNVLHCSIIIEGRMEAQQFPRLSDYSESENG